ncbi:hypothetical protein ABT185_34290 [Streptomyces clavifer]
MTVRLLSLPPPALLPASRRLFPNALGHRNTAAHVEEAMLNAIDLS